MVDSPLFPLGSDVPAISDPSPWNTIVMPLLKRAISNGVVFLAAILNTKWGVQMTPETTALVVSLAFLLVNGLHSYIVRKGMLKSLTTLSMLMFLAVGLSGCMTNADGTVMSPQQKFIAVCDEYWAGEETVGSLIEGLASVNPTSAAVYTGAKIVIQTACIRNIDGSYLNANPSGISVLLPEALGAAGKLATLFL